MYLLKLAGYRLKIIIGSPHNLFLLFVAPLLAVLLTAYISAGIQDPYRVAVAVADLDQSEYSRTVRERAAEKAVLNLRYMDAEDAIRSVKTGKLETAFILNSGFMENILRGKLDGIITVIRSPNSISAEFLAELFAAEVIRLSGNVLAAEIVLKQYRSRGIPEDASNFWHEVWTFSDAHWEPEPLVTVAYNEFGDGGDLEPAGISRRLLSVIGPLTAFLLLMIFFQSGWLAADWESGLLARSILLSGTPWPLIFGNSLAVLIFALISSGLSLAVMAILAKTVFFLQPLFLLLLALYLFAGWAISLLVAVVAGNRWQLQAAGLFFVLVAGLLGGSYFPVGELFTKTGLIARLTPQYWYLAATGDILYVGRMTKSILQALLILPAMGLLMLWFAKRMVSYDKRF